MLIFIVYASVSKSKAIDLNIYGNIYLNDLNKIACGSWLSGHPVYCVITEAPKTNERNINELHDGWSFYSWDEYFLIALLHTHFMNGGQWILKLVLLAIENVIQQGKKINGRQNRGHFSWEQKISAHQMDSAIQ